MTRIMKIAAVAISVLLVIVTIGCRTSQVSIEAPQSCDTEAAHPLDIQRLAPGKSDEEIVPALAVRACTAAVNQFPHQARFQFQLGRALLAMKRSDDATKAFNKAASMGYKQANFYLAEAKLESFWEAESEKDLEEIRALLTAADSFPPAVERLGQITFDANAFSSPRLVQALWDGDYQRLNQSRLVVALYLRGMHDFLATEFHPESQDCPGYIVDPSIIFNLDQAIEGDPRSTIEGGKYYLAIKAAEYAGLLVWDPVWKGSKDKWTEYYKGLGRRDGQYLAHHCGCSSPVTSRLYRNLTQLAKVQRPLSEYWEGMLDGDAKELFSKENEPVAGEK